MVNEEKIDAVIYSFNGEYFLETEEDYLHYIEHYQLNCESRKSVITIQCDKAIFSSCQAFQHTPTGQAWLRELYHNGN